MSDELTRLVMQEARLLDEGRLDDWLAMYAQDATYWVPIDENANPLKDSSVIFDNHLRLSMRVEQIVREGRVAQSPPSETLRMITNLAVEADDGERGAVTFAMLLVETRGGDWRQRGLGETRMFPARCRTEFKRVGGEWKIAHKKIVLLHRKRPIEGLSFIL
jgi:3-phenylpropionate/cinnamic acid dioxygenase small subunit